MLKERSLLVALTLLVAFSSFLSVTVVSISVKTNRVASASASTIVSGYITTDTTWTLAGSPYIVVGGVIVDRSAVLTIEPGVVVKFTAGKNLVIDGSLIAEGNATHKITFTSNATSPAPGDWAGILIRSDARFRISDSVIEFATNGIDIENASLGVPPASVLTRSRILSNAAGIRMGGWVVTFDGLTIENNTDYGIYGNDGEIYIRNSLISKNGIGIRGSGGSASIYNCTISKNRYEGIFSGSVMHIGDLVNSRIENNGGWGINIAAELQNCRDTRISNNSGGGVRVDFWTGAKIYNSNITDNSGGGVLSLYGLTVSGSTISNNSNYGVWAQSVNIESTTIIHNGNAGISAGTGNVHFSNVNNNTMYEVKSNAQENINATHNWWGTTNETLIKERIYDYFDDSSVGVVSYVPLLNSSKATLTILTNGISSNQPLSVKIDGTGAGLVHDEKPLSVTLHSGQTQPRMSKFSLSIDDIKIWDSNPNVRYKFANWAGSAGSSTSNSIALTITANSSITAFYKTEYFYTVNFADSFKDSKGRALYIKPSSFKLTFPNGTTSALLNPDLSYYIQNGTTTWSSIIWQGTEVRPSDATFDPTNGNPTVNCKVYSLTVDPVFYDITGTALVQPSSWSIKFPNGTTTTVSSSMTYDQTQAGDYSIVSIIWRGTEVIPAISPTVSLTSDKLWSPSTNCLLPTSLSISLSSSTSYIGFKVEIKGNLTCNEAGLSGTPILLSYSVTGGEPWSLLTDVDTASDGGYSAVWIPSATGNYLVRAMWSGNATYLGTTTIISLAVIPFSEQNVFSVTSNSTISELAFNSTGRELSFTMSGPSGTTGYVNVYIAKTLIENVADVKVYLDGNRLNYTATSLDESWLLHFTYLHSTHKVAISLGTISPPFTETPLGKAVVYGMFVTAIIIVTAITGLTIFRRTRRISTKRPSPPSLK